MCRLVAALVARLALVAEESVAAIATTTALVTRLTLVAELAGRLVSEYWSRHSQD